MKNYINYKGLTKSELGLVKYSQLKHRNIDTIVLNELKYWDDVENTYDELKNIKTIIIDDKKIKNNAYSDNYVAIQNTRAENIYFKDQDNLGGLTINVEKARHDIDLKWYRERQCKLKEINLVFPTKTEKIILGNNIISIHLVSYFLENELKFSLAIEDNKQKTNYSGNINSGIIEKEYGFYTYTSDNVKNDILDLREFEKAEKIYCYNINVDTLLITKNILFGDIFKQQFDEKLSINKLKIIDENEMKLNPEIEVNFEGLIEIYDYFITDGEKTKFIYLDRNDDLKIIYKDKLLENENIEDVEFIVNSDCELILVKYKNKTCKIIDKYNEYIIDELFGDFLYLNINSYDFYEEEIPHLKLYITNKEWDKPFKDKILDNNILGTIYDDYLKFIERIKELKKLGLKDKAIKYLISRKYDNLINTKSRNILDIKEIKKDEIELFNFISENITYEKAVYKTLKK